MFLSTLCLLFSLLKEMKLSKRPEGIAFWNINHQVCILLFCYGEVSFLSSGILAIILRCIEYLSCFILCCSIVIKFMFRKLMVGDTMGEWLFSSFYLFCWVYLAMQERWIQHLRQKVLRFGLFVPYNADPPSESNQTYCFLVFAIDRTYSTKQKTNWLELYDLIGTCMAYLEFSYPYAWAFCISYLELIQHTHAKDWFNMLHDRLY
jgi:hypothetical protein